ncbi:uncharacterized protein LOC111045071 [Nilaparvata lugens]|uniref:uncharacterized protein LOC111045071 n=1 Tax=Nilaparvata lugens TaxID=108931 RepID=UPI00193E3CC2|nr:uncharacterized protein LOC111045071 [Nilaparvata lugens]
MSSNNGASAKRQDDDVIEPQATEKAIKETNIWSQTSGVSAPPARLPSPPPYSTGDGAQLDFFNKVYRDLPIISKPLDVTTCVYRVIKNSNCLSTCVFDAAERTVGCLKSTANEKINYIVNPKFIKDVDNGLCQTLDCVEYNVPCIKFDPFKMFLYVCSGRCALNCVCQSIDFTFETVRKILSTLLCKKNRETQSAIEAAVADALPTRT